MPAKAASRQLSRLWSAEGFGLVASLVQGLVVARALGPDLYGVYALALTFAGFVFLVLDPRSGEAVVRFLAEFKADQDTVNGRAVVRGGLLLDAAWGVAGLGLVSALAVPASLVLHIEGNASLIPVVGLGLAVVAPATTGRAVLGVFERFDTISNRQFVVVAIRVLSVCAVAVGGLGLSGVIWTLSLASVVECCLFVDAALRVTRDQLGGGVRGVSVKVLRHRRREMIGFVGYSGLTTLASSAFKQVDTLLVGAITGPREAGFYRLAKSLTAPAGSVGTPVQTILYPRLALLESKRDWKAADAMIRRTFLRVELPLALLALAAIPFVGLAVQVLAGEAFAGAVQPAVALVVGVAVSFATLQQRPVFLVRNELRALLAFTMTIAVVSLLLFVPAADLGGADGVAWTRTGVLALATLGMAVYLRWSRDARRDVHPAKSAAGR